MIGSLGQHRKEKEALKLFEEMKQEGIKPDSSTLVTLLNACSHIGNISDALSIMNRIEKGEFGIKPTIEHHNCIIDALGRIGRLEEAEKKANELLKEADIITWKTLLGACRSHGDISRAERSAKEALRLDPTDASIYVLLSNIYAEAGKWKEQSQIRNMMKERGITKGPGISSIEVKGQLYSFVKDDPKSKGEEVKQYLKKLHERMKEKRIQSKYKLGDKRRYGRKRKRR